MHIQHEHHRRGLGAIVRDVETDADLHPRHRSGTLSELMRRHVSIWSGTRSLAGSRSHYTWALAVHGQWIASVTVRCDAAIARRFIARLLEFKPSPGRPAPACS